MNLIEETRRKEVLTHFGFSKSFLDAIDTIRLIDHNLSYVINYPEGAYYYLPTIKNYSIYDRYNVVPICDSGQGDSFYILLFNDSEHKIVYNEVERDEIYVNFGLSIHAFIARVLIEYYDLMEDEDVEDRDSVLKKMGKLGLALGMENNSLTKVMERIFKAEDNGEDRFSNSRKWFNENIQSLL